ncbi:MAG TPA: hypothetical protein VJ846_12800 [Sphingomicrobium sp.]|nr:hypothetical protein [Sphingomicrobium sp.]
MSKREHRELKIHIAVAQHLRTRAVSGLVWWHTPNGGFRDKREAAKFKAMGLQPGVSDFIFVHANRIYALELKAEGGRASEAQLKFLSDINAAGAYTAMPAGLNAALRTLETWGLIKPAVIMKSILQNMEAAE